MVALVAESLADEQAREEEEEEQGARGSCGATTGHNPPSPKWKMDREREDGSMLGIRETA